MGRPKIKVYQAKNPDVAADYSTTSMTEYCAPTVGLEDHVFTFGKAKYAAKLEIVKEKLGKTFSTQNWNNGADSAQAFDTSNEPVYINPTEPPLLTQFVKITNTDSTIRSKEDPEYESKDQRYKMLTTMFTTEHR